jgi:homoserine kinase
VRVPATSGNVGPGFDCFGVALTLYNHFQFIPADQVRITASGLGSANLDVSVHNLVYRSWLKCWQMLNQNPPPVHLHIDMHIPLSRGLGSSATAICAGITAANVWAGQPLSQGQLISLATDLEGHPDNVTPALVGGAQLIVDRVVCPIPWHENLAVVVAIPDFELSTTKARQVLPEMVSRESAIFNTAHLALLTQALATGNPDWLRTALQDRLHQPYRTPLIPAMTDILQGAMAQGAYGVVISGAGPSLLAITPPDRASAVGSVMTHIWRSRDIQSTYLVLAIDTQGTVVTQVNP